MAPGVSLAEQFSTSGERLGELRLAAVRLAASNVNDASGAWEWLRLLLATGTCARPRPGRTGPAHDLRLHGEA